MKTFGNIIWGLVLIILGVIIGVNALGIADINIFFDGWWTLIIIIPCFIGIFKNESKIGNFIGLMIGLLLLLSCQDILEFDMIFKLTIPLILVVIGLSIMFKDIIGSEVNKEIKKLNSANKEKNEYCSTFSAQDIAFDEEIKNATLTSVFGGIKCDLRNAIIKNDVVINATTIFGGIDILVPDNVKIKIKSTSIFGGVSDDRKKDKKDDPSKYVIYINASCVFGGVEIK